MSELSGFLREKQVLKLIPIAPSTWWQGVKDGRYPKPVKLSPKVTVWRTDDIRALIDGLGAGQEAKKGGKK